MNGIVLSTTQTDSPFSDGTDTWPFLGSAFLMQKLFLWELEKPPPLPGEAAKLCASWHSQLTCDKSTFPFNHSSSGQGESYSNSTFIKNESSCCCFKRTCARQECTGFYFTGSFCPISNVLGPFWSAKWIPPSPWHISFFSVRKEERQSSPTC
jgi:hypothetical protein